MRHERPVQDCSHRALHWQDDGITDCYMAFFGRERPGADRQPERPYVLRFNGTSLEVVRDGP